MKPKKLSLGITAHLLNRADGAQVPNYAMVYVNDVPLPAGKTMPSSYVMKACYVHLPSMSVAVPRTGIRNAYNFRDHYWDTHISVMVKAENSNNKETHTYSIRLLDDEAPAQHTEPELIQLVTDEHSALIREFSDREFYGIGWAAFPYDTKETVSPERLEKIYDVVRNFHLNQLKLMGYL